MRGILFLLPALAGLGAPALADDPLPHYVRTGNALVCQAEAGKPAADDTPCLAIGDAAVGMRRGRVEFRLGKPAQTMKVGERNYFGYALAFSNAGQGVSADHFAVTSATVSYTADGTVDSLQITGQPWDSAWRFCGLTLGDSETALRARLGEPMQTGTGIEPGVTLLSYGSTVAIGVRDGKISSIRVAKNGG